MENNVRSQVKSRKLHKTWENASDQVLIGCSIQYDWLRMCASF